VERAFLGWGFINIRRNIIVNENAPELYQQDWVEKLHTPEALESFWNERLKQGFVVQPHLVENAIDILVHPDYIATERLCRDPEVVYFPTAYFHSVEDSYMVLANGYNRMVSAWSLYDDVKSGFNREYLEFIPWLVKFYNYGGYWKGIYFTLIYTFTERLVLHPQSDELLRIVCG
jgi:hypothetical protein